MVNGEYDEAAKSYVANLDTDTFKAYGVKSAFLRKLDRLSQLQLLSGVRALEDAGITVTTITPASSVYASEQTKDR